MKELMTSLLFGKVLTALLADSDKLKGVQYYCYTLVQPSYPQVAFVREGMTVRFLAETRGEETYLVSSHLDCELAKVGVRLQDLLCPTFSLTTKGRVNVEREVPLSGVDDRPANLIRAILQGVPEQIGSGNSPPTLWSVKELILQSQAA